MSHRQVKRNIEADSIAIKRLTHPAILLCMPKVPSTVCCILVFLHAFDFEAVLWLYRGFVVTKGLRGGVVRTVQDAQIGERVPDVEYMPSEGL